jgi:hypothetical protein
MNDKPNSQIEAELLINYFKENTTTLYHAIDHTVFVCEQMKIHSFKLIGYDNKYWDGVKEFAINYKENNKK